jgi:hypothetical protein
VTEPGDVLLGRAEIERAFTALGSAWPAGRRRDVFVVGGAAMAMAYDAARVTRDVDAAFKPHGIVLEEARKVADDLGLPYWWLNEQASVYISGKEDASRRRVFDHPGLRVMAASPAHVFAMKARAARPPVQATAHPVVTAGMPGWQITPIALGAALIAAVIAVLLDRTGTARRLAHPAI